MSQAEILEKKVPIRTLGAELRRYFGCRVHKIPLHAGLTCPNRDGTLATGGCLFCDANGSAATGSDPGKSITAQLRSGIAYGKKRFRADKFIAYFQPFSNTYAPIPRLQRLWGEAIGVEEVVGLSIGTRPDCLPDTVLDLIAAFQARLEYLDLEIGVQSAHDRTLQRIGRGHDFACVVDAVQRAHQREIPLCAHVILGLPGESMNDMIETVQALLDLQVEGIKLHHLHVLKGTPLEQAYRAGQIPLLEQEEYVEIVCRIVERISDRMVIHRFMGEAPPARLVAPEWTGRKRDVQAAIFHKMGRG
ncbi:MAG: TIGR01212 family radical SAM protein [Deltaproteobacteria bacterium]|nr:TIGR01212 family radical SAM protein [Deltaproteobacteria bacterium]